jgi:ABC-type antimicrobial peptide transport system permease subunit
MKFRNKAGSVSAGIDLVKLASRQNGIAEIDICGTTYGSGGFGSYFGPITYSQAMEQSTQNVKLYTKLNKSSGASNKTHHDYSTFFLVVGIFAFVVALYVIFDVQSMFTARADRKKKTPLLHELS